MPVPVGRQQVQTQPLEQLPQQEIRRGIRTVPTTIQSAEHDRADPTPTAGSGCCNSFFSKIHDVVKSIIDWIKDRFSSAPEQIPHVSMPVEDPNDVPHDIETPARPPINEAYRAEYEQTLAELDAALVPLQAAVDQANAALVPLQAAADQANAVLAPLQAAADQADADLEAAQTAVNRTSQQFAVARINIGIAEADLFDGDLDAEAYALAVARVNNGLAPVQAALNQAVQVLRETRRANQRAHNDLEAAQVAVNEANQPLRLAQARADAANVALRRAQARVDQINAAQVPQ